MRNLKNVPNAEFSVGIGSGKDFPLEINPIAIEGNITIPPRTPKLQSLPFSETITPVFNQVVTFPAEQTYQIQDTLPVFPLIEKQECFLLTASGDNIILTAKKDGKVTEMYLQIECL